MYYTSISSLKRNGPRYNQKKKTKKTFPSVPHCFKFSTNETLNCHESSQVNLHLEISQCLCIMTTDLTMTVNKIWSVGTKCKAHHQVAFPTKQLQHVLPHVVREKCYSVSPVHESTVIVEKKKEIKINIYTSPYTSKKVQRASISPLFTPYVQQLRQVVWSLFQ